MEEELTKTFKWKPREVDEDIMIMDIHVGSIDKSDGKTRE